MDNQEYLKQISSTVRPEKKSTGFLSSTLFKVIVGGVAAIIVVVVMGSILTGGQTNNKERLTSLKLHIENTLSIISSYQSNIKSSSLRSSSTSFSGVLSNTNRELTDYIKERKLSYKNDSAEYKKMKKDADNHKDELDADLFEAKINGILDRIFAHKMALEISLIAAEEDSISRAEGGVLESILSTSYNSLNNLYDNFNEFSETK